jgi:hypothetical protein
MTSRRPKVFLGPLDALEDGGLVGDVQLQREYRLAVGGDQLVEARGVPGGRGHLVAAGQGGLDEVAAEAAGRTGDEPDLAHDVFRSLCGGGCAVLPPDEHEAPVTRPL